MLYKEVYFEVYLLMDETHCSSLFLPKIEIETFKKALLTPLDDQSSFKDHLIQSKFNLLAAEIEDSVKKVEQILQPRSVWPKKLNFFPFNFKFLQRLVLRIYEVLFREQRQAKLQLLRITQNLLSINQELILCVNHLLKNQKYMQNETKKIPDSLE